ncbi:phosphomevalonate kinase [Streptomyces sp. NBC_00989]|uniref:phosphomevalonate kinase n=1 Tax=Streptomyces sp. NBC_00989 TaxID=2903705 RepID=UPI00386C1E4A|nr:phosphomevalonate kinase [Streptomyces sp. NBC_00989]WSW98018.1 phosphomevalonate kinase [Streptomyces sp. NBC_00989]
MTAPTAMTTAVSAGRTVVRRAPGKLFVAGEYAVVEPGNPAILVAVDRDITVTVTGAPGSLGAPSALGSLGSLSGSSGLGGPGKPGEPGESGESGAPGGSRRLRGPGGSSGPGSPDGPRGPGAPSGPHGPGGSSEFSAPDNPGAPSSPGAPHAPHGLDEPGTARNLTAPGSPDVVISSDLIPQAVAWRWQEGRLVVHGAGAGAGGRSGDGARARGALAHVVSAVETVGALLAELGLGVPALKVSVSSRLHEGGRKYGLGSSGAVTVAAVDAVAAFCGVGLSAGERYRLALLASARIDPKGSGGDLAASAWGGWILYRAPERAFVLDLARRVGITRTLAAPWPGHAVRRLPPPAGLRLEVGWTGEPVSTASLVAGLHRRGRGRQDGAARGRYTEASNRLVEAAVRALERGDDGGLLEQIRTARVELARLDEAVGLGIFTPRLTRLCEAAEAVGGAAKPSGAGGGDCGIALLDAAASRHICQVRRRWSAAGVEALPVHPAARRPGRTPQP